jgi:hypothetical protein
LPNQSEAEKIDDLRKRSLDVFAQDWECLLFLLNGFLCWRGTVENEEQRHLHNAAEAYVIFLMGPPTPARLDSRYLEQLETLMGDYTPLARMSGMSETPHDKPRRRRKAVNG